MVLYYQTKVVGLCHVRTVWEIKQKTLVDMAVSRSCYIDQSQSLNIHMEQPDLGKLTSLHFYAWSKVSFHLFMMFPEAKPLFIHCTIQFLLSDVSISKITIYSLYHTVSA